MQNPVQDLPAILGGLLMNFPQFGMIVRNTFNKRSYIIHMVTYFLLAKLFSHCYLLTKVSELLESGKTAFKELVNAFEERMITIHKEQIEKWQEDIKELRLLDASNEEDNVLLHNARYLIQSAQIDS